MIIEQKEADDLVLNINSTLRKVSEIDSVTNLTLNVFQKNLDNTVDIYNEYQKYHDNIKSILEQERLLYAKYNQLSSKIQKQIDYDEKQILANTPIITFPINKFEWKTVSDTLLELTICMQNAGIRPVELVAFDANFFSSIDGNYKKTYFPKIAKPVKLPSYSAASILHCYSSNAFSTKFEKPHHGIDLAIIEINYSVFDQWTNDTSKLIKHFIWSDMNGFNEIEMNEILKSVNSN